MVKVYTGGSFLKALPEVKGKALTIKNEGKYVESKYAYPDGNPKTDFIFEIVVEGEEKKLRMNKASQVAMIEAFGDESSEWIGQRARIIIMPTPNGENKMIVLDPITEVQPQTKSPEQAAWDEE